MAIYQQVLRTREGSKGVRERARTRARAQHHLTHSVRCQRSDDLARVTKTLTSILDGGFGRIAVSLLEEARRRREEEQEALRKQRETEAELLRLKREHPREVRDTAGHLHTRLGVGGGVQGWHIT